MASILDKYKHQSQSIGKDLKEQGVELEGDAKQSQIGNDNVNVAGGYEHLGKGEELNSPDNDQLKAAWEQAKEEKPDIQQGLSQVQIQEQEQER